MHIFPPRPWARAKGDHDIWEIEQWPVPWVSLFSSPDLSFPIWRVGLLWGAPPCPSLRLSIPNAPSGSWRCTCPWTGTPSCSRACSPSPGPWPARGRRGTLCRQTSTRRQIVSQAQLGQNCLGDTGNKGLTYFSSASGQWCPNPPTSLKPWTMTLVGGTEETAEAAPDELNHV